MNQAVVVGATKTIAAVLDTNAFLDVYSCRDVFRDYDALYATMGGAAAEDPRCVYRRARARESLLLAIYLHQLNVATVTLQDELLKELEGAAPPKTLPGAPTSFETVFTTTVIHFTKDAIIPDWEPGFSNPQPGWEKTLPPDLLNAELLVAGHKELEKPTGTRADTFHIACAKHLGVPLITNEGFGEEGYGKGTVIKRAERAGVTGLRPYEFYRGQLDEEKAIDWFLKRFKEEAPKYLDEREKKHGADKSREAFTLIYSIYRNILRGEAEGRTTPLAVRVGR
jgi:hypothetical protein